MERQLTEGRPFSVLLRYALPVLGGNLFQLFYTLADTVIVGKTLGADALAAVGSTGIISYFVLCFVQGLTGGFGICLGQCCGAGDEIGMRRSAAVSWTLSAVFTLLLTPLVCLRPAGARLDADAGGHLRRRLCLSFRDTARHRRDGFL